jgi:hypothetical protein
MPDKQRMPRRADGRAPTGAASAPGLGLVGATRCVMAQMSELTGAAAASVSELADADEGWRMCVDVVELERIPQSTSILATYEVIADRAGNVRSYRRLRRYVRSEAG